MRICGTDPFTLFGDLDGNGGNEQTQADVYDLEDRLTQTVRGATTVTLTYDGDGHRVKKVAGATTTWYLVDDRNPTGYAQVLEERTTASGSPTVLYTYGADLLCQTRGATTHYYVYDALGSVRALVNTSGQLTDSYTYDAYGILIEKRTLSGGSLVPTTGGTLNSYLFTGEQWDADLGMYYLRARYYAPGLGRFWNFDTFEGSHSDPLSLHKYLYAHANPVNGVDPSGHEFSFVGTLTALTTAEGLQTMKAAVDTRIQWSIRNMAKQIVNDAMPNDLNQQLGKQGEEVWEKYLNKVPGFRVMRAKGSVSGVGPDIYGIALRNRRIVVFIGEVKASDGRVPGIGKLEWNVVNATRQMSANWIDNYASKAVEGLLEMGLEGLGLGQFKQLNRAGKIEVYLLGALRKFNGWKIRGFRMMHLGDDEVIPDTTEGGFPEITNERDLP